MAAGDPLSGAEHAALDDTMRTAEQRCRAEFSVFIGAASGAPRDHATSLHNSLVAPARSVLVMVDPDQRVLEVVTGGHVRRALSDRDVELAVTEMQDAFAAGDLLGGLQRGILLMAEHASAVGS